MKLIHMFFLVGFILPVKTTVLAQDVTNTSSEQKSDIQNRGELKPEQVASSTNNTDTDANSDAVEEAPTPSDLTISPKLAEPHEYPGSLLGLGLTATPDVYFERSISHGALVLGLFDSESKSIDASGSVKTNVSIDVGAIAFGYAMLLPSKKLFLRIDAITGRATYDYSLTSVSNAGSAEITSKGKRDSIVPALAIAFEASPGFWIGTYNNWERTYISADPGDLNPVRTTSRKDTSSRVISLEYRSSMAHAGLNYSIKNATTETTSWELPLRLALTETLFFGTSFESENEKDFSSPNTISGSSTYITELGFQTASSALSFQFEYKLKQEGESTEGSTNDLKEKTKTGRLIGVFGPKKGLRFGFTLDYGLGKEYESSGEETKSKSTSVELSLSHTQ